MLWDTCFSFLILEIKFSLQVESHDKKNCSLHIVLLGQLSLYNIPNGILLYLGISRSYHVYKSTEVHHENISQTMLYYIPETYLLAGYGASP